MGLNVYGNPTGIKMPATKAVAEYMNIEYNAKQIINSLQELYYAVTQENAKMTRDSIKLTAERVGNIERALSKLKTLSIEWM